MAPILGETLDSGDTALVRISYYMLSSDYGRLMGVRFSLERDMQHRVEAV
jgi:hypothetical protein